MGAKQICKTAVTRLALNYIRPSWPQKQFLKHMLRRQEIDCVLDVGANVGQYGSELRQIGYTGTIISFEPDPDAFERLQIRASKDARWLTRNIGLGASEGTLTLNRMAISQFNSFHSPSIEDTKVFQEYNRIIDRVPVPVNRLDHIWPELQKVARFSRVFLKMDTQGYDLEVFKGASAAWGQIRGLQSEAAVDRLYDGSPGFATSLDVYRTAGFALAGVFAVNPDQDIVLEMDCYFLPKTEQGGDQIEPR